MIVERKPLTLPERFYLPALANGFKVTWKHFRRTALGGRTAADDTAGGYYPEVPWKVEPGYRGAPYLVRDQDGDTKCVSCQLCEFICPPKAIRITPPGPEGPGADRENAEKMPEAATGSTTRTAVCQGVAPAPSEARRSPSGTPRIASSAMV